jgi:hypothetical protein
MSAVFVRFGTPVCGVVEVLKHQGQQHLGEGPTFSGVKRSPRRRFGRPLCLQSRLSDPRIFA